MGLIKAAMGAFSGTLGDQWKEFFYCDSLPSNVLVSKGAKRVNKKRSSNTHGSENIISNGSIIAINEGQCMMIVEQGAIVEFSAEPGEYQWNNSSEPSIFAGSLGQSISDSFHIFGKRFTMGGDTGKDQRIYFFNLKEMMGNKYGTPSPVPFRVVDQNIGLDIDISVRCHGEYSYHLCNPILFYKNVCGNVEQDYTMANMESQLKSELLTALQPAFAKLSEMGIRYSALPGHTMELTDALKDVLTEKWQNTRGIEIMSIGVNSVKASEEDEATIKELQKSAVFRNPNMAAAHLTQAQAEAMKLAAGNQNAGPAMAFMGMGMANNMGGMNAQALYQMGQQQSNSQQQQTSAPQQTPAMDGWTCVCGAVNTGKFCQECGAKKPIPEDGWTCSCGTVNKGKFCQECGAKKPTGIPQYRCDKCGWEPADMSNPPKFCPECGDPFDDGDLI